MSASGFQDFWVTGSRLYFKRNALSDGTNFDYMDLGTIQVANPTLNITKATLRDSDGGVLSICAEKITQQDETYDITCSNLNMDNFALLFNANPPSGLTQSAEQKAVAHNIYEAGRLVKLHDDDADSTNLFNLSAIAGVTSAAVSGGVLSTDAFTAIVASTKTITTAGDLSADLSPGDQIIIDGTGLANILNAGTYTVASVTATTVVTTEDFAADETAITGNLIYAASGDTGTVYNEDTDWEQVSTVGLQRGLIRVIDGGAIADGDTPVVHFSTAAITATDRRVINPQSASAIEGTALIFFSRENHVQENVRECTVAVTPNAANLNDEDFSNMVLTFTVLNDLTQTNPAGRFVYHKGTEPSLS